MKDLYGLMHPKSIAIIGASPREGTVGNEVISRVVEGNFTGKIFAINPKYTQIIGVPCYPTILDIEDKIDLAIIVVPAKSVLDTLIQCNKVGTKLAVIISAGFKEIGGDGVELEKQIKDYVNQNGMTIVGPNCLGVLNTDPKYNLNATFAPQQAIRGTIGLASQSGALASGIITMLPKLNIGVSQIISLGNQADTSSLDVLKLWENDDSVKQILLYLESLPNYPEFREVATRVAAKKPLLIVKSGRSARGARATASHTGSLAGDDNVVQGILESCGVIRESNLRDMFYSAEVLSKCPIPKGNKTAILTNVGGPGILATDTASYYNLPLADLTDETKEKLRSVLPPQASVNNPVDIIASATPEDYKNSAEILLQAKEVDMLLVIYLYINGKNDLNVMQEIQKLNLKYPQKPIVAMVMTTEDFNKELREAIPNCSIPTFDYVTDAVRGLSRLAKRADFLKNADLIKQNTDSIKADTNTVATIISQANQENLSNLTTLQSLDIFKAYQLPIPAYGNAFSLDEAKAIAKNITGYPVVLKISSKTVTHKSDVGGVVVNIKNEADLEKQWNALLDRLNKANLTSSLDGIVVMQQVKGSGRELVCGIIKQNDMHQLMFGLGGIFIEALKEVAFRPCPLSEYDVISIINSTKAKNIIGALRGKSGVDMDYLKETLLRFSKLVTDFPQIKEIDANPVMLDDDGNLFVVDARIIL